MQPLINSQTLNAIMQIVVLVGAILAIVKPFTARWPSVYSGISRVVRALPAPDPVGAAMDDHTPPAPKLPAKGAES